MNNFFSLLQFRASRRKRRTRGRQRLARFESLESRHLLAGNVTAAVVDGDLRLVGDSLDNTAMVSVIEGDVVVEGLDDTTVNGRDAPFTAFSGSSRITDDLLARLGRGGDVLLLAGGLEVADRVAISGGSGSVRVGLDAVTVGGTVGIFGTPGGDVVHFSDVEVAGDVRMRLRQGDDVVNVSDTAVDDLTISTARGADAVILDTLTSAGDVNTNTGRGSDDLVVKDSDIGDDLVVRTRTGHDFVMIDPSTIGDRFVGRFGRGNDNFVDRDGNRYGSVSIHSGRGRDAADFDAATTIDGPRVAGKTESDSVPDSVIDTRLNDPEDGALTKAVAAAEFFAPFLDEPELTLTVDTSANDTIESNDTLLTNDPTFNIAGTTGAGVTVEVDRDGDGAFDDGTTTANALGEYSLDVTLIHNDDNRGANALSVRATRDGEELSEAVNVHLAVGTIVRFDSDLGAWDVELLDEDAPNTVGAFLDDLARYNDSIVHRTVSDFIIQGGGFIFNAATDSITDVPDFPAPPNEFADASPPNSNVRGTLSTAQVGGNINSFTGQWFVNTVDNDGSGPTNNLDNVPHTVFGRVIGDGMSAVDDIEAVETFNLVSVLPNSSALGAVPLRNYAPVYDDDITGTVSTGITSLDEQGQIQEINGTGTLFLSELRAGQELHLNGEVRTIRNIVSNTQLVVRGEFTDVIDDTAQVNSAIPDDADFIKTTSITKLFDPLGSENTFGVLENAANGTEVGQVTRSDGQTDSVIFEFDDPAIADELQLAADDHYAGPFDASVVLIDYSDYG